MDSRGREWNRRCSLGVYGPPWMRNVIEVRNVIKGPAMGQLRIYNIICSTVVVPGAGATKVECVLKQIKMIRDRVRAVR